MPKKRQQSTSDLEGSKSSSSSLRQLSGHSVGSEASYMYTALDDMSQSNVVVDNDSVSDGLVEQVLTAPAPAYMRSVSSSRPCLIPKVGSVPPPRAHSDTSQLLSQLLGELAENTAAYLRSNGGVVNATDFGNVAKLRELTGQAVHDSPSTADVVSL